MSKTVSVVFLALLLTSTLTAAFNFQPANTRVRQGIDGPQSRITEHRMTSSELQQLESTVGVDENSRNYDQMIDGHGTGLAPPSAEEWESIEKEAYVIDEVSSPTSSSLPSSVDNSATPWFPPIGGQGNQNSCVAWAVGYYMNTFMQAKEHGWDVSGGPANETMSPSFIYNLIDNGTDNVALNFFDAIQLVCSVGECSLAQMPFNDSDCTSWPSTSAWQEAPYYRGASTGFEELNVSTDSGISSLKNWIASENLAIIAVDANQYSQLTSNEVWTMDNYRNPVVDHANTIVGYDDNMKYMERGKLTQGAFKIANSWGTGFGADGFYWISYQAMKQEVGYVMFYQGRTGYVPTLTCSFQIKHPLRGDCRIVIGMGPHDNPTTSKEFTEYINGGNQPFPAKNIVFDITEFEDVVPDICGQPFFLSVYDVGTSVTGTVLYFSVADTVSQGTPLKTVDGGYVYADLTLTDTLTVRGLDNRIYYCCDNGAQWQSWTALTGSTLDSPATAMLGNQLHMVVRGSDGSMLWYGKLTNASDPTSFSGWTLIRGATSSAPTLASNGTMLCLVVRGLDNRVYYCCYSGGVWGPWYVVPKGATPGAPAAAMLGNYLHIVVRGMDGSSLWDTIVSCDGTVVRGWTLLSGATPSKPDLASSGADSLCLVVRGMNNAIYYRSYTGSNDSWAGWSAFPTGATNDGPAATVVGNVLCTVVRGSDGSTLWCGDIDLGTTSFTGWTLLSGATPSAPTLAS